MTSTPPPHEQATATGTEEADPDAERLPSFAEQMADQLGGWRGLAESSVPVVVFVLANILTSVKPAVIASVVVAVLIAGLRLAQRRPVRHAVNGLVGIGIGAFIAWRTGDSRDFYLPGILYGLGYGAVLLISAAIGQPLVGWIWSVIADGGRADWRHDARLVRTFTWLTLLWGVVWLIKVGVQALFWAADMDTALGVSRLLLGYPPYAILLAVTLWVVRRVRREYDTAPAN